jgi:hypothetical protein
METTTQTLDTNEVIKAALLESKESVYSQSSRECLVRAIDRLTMEPNADAETLWELADKIEIEVMTEHPELEGVGIPAMER